MAGPKFAQRQKVRCVSASEIGISIKEGSIYTVKRWVAKGGPAFAHFGDGPIKEVWNDAGVELEEVGGYYLASRFEALEETNDD